MRHISTTLCCSCVAYVSVKAPASVATSRASLEMMHVRMETTAAKAEVHNSAAANAATEYCSMAAELDPCAVAMKTERGTDPAAEALQSPDLPQPKLKLPDDLKGKFDTAEKGILVLDSDEEDEELQMNIDAKAAGQHDDATAESSAAKTANAKRQRASNGDGPPSKKQKKDTADVPPLPPPSPPPPPPAPPPSPPTAAAATSQPPAPPSPAAMVRARRCTAPFCVLPRSMTMCCFICACVPCRCGFICTNVPSPCSHSMCGSYQLCTHGPYVLFIVSSVMYIFLVYNRNGTAESHHPI